MVSQSVKQLSLAGEGGCPELVKQEETKSFLRASVGGRTGMLMKQLSSDLT